MYGNPLRFPFEFGEDTELRILRDRVRVREEDLDRSETQEPFVSARILVQVADGGHMPTAPDHYFLTHPVTQIKDAPCEGCPATPTVDTNTNYYVDFIRGVPAVGDFAVATAVGGRWVAEKTGCTWFVMCRDTSGVPLVGATVRIHDPVTNAIIATAVTAADGRATFSMPGGLYIIQVNDSLGTLIAFANVTVKCGDLVEMCNCPVTFKVTDCSGHPVPNAVIVLSPDGGVTIFTLQTDDTGTAVFYLKTTTLGPMTSWTVTVSLRGQTYTTYARVEPLSCNQVITIKLLPTGTYAAQFYVTGCCGYPLPGATVTVAGINYTTDANGFAGIGITDAGTYTWSVTKARFGAATGSFTIGDCGLVLPIKVGPPLAPGYACGPPVSQPSGNKRPDPIPTTLNFTDSVWGPLTLTFDGTNWSGTKTVSFSAECLCLAQMVTIHYTLQGVGATECSHPSTSHEIIATYAYCNLSIFGIPETAGCPSDHGYHDAGTGYSCLSSGTEVVQGVMTIPDGLPFAAIASVPNSHGACVRPLLYPNPGVIFGATEP